MTTTLINVLSIQMCRKTAKLKRRALIKLIIGIVVMLGILLQSQFANADVLLDVPATKQLENQWCWAAVSQATLSYYETAVAQCTIADWVRLQNNWGNDNCCSNPGGAICNQPNSIWGTGASLWNILANWGVNSNIANGYLTQSIFVSEINAGRPFIMRWGWTGCSLQCGHFLVGRGYDQNGDFMSYMDPAYGDYYKTLYSWVVSEPFHSWTHTLQVTTNPPPPTVPGAPMEVTAVAGDTQATVSFTEPASNGRSAITGYNVISSPAGGVDINAGTTATQHMIIGLTNGVPYTFTVTATNAVGTGPASAPSNSVTPATVPDASTRVTAVAGDTQATVSFTEPASNGGGAITGYNVISSPAGGVDINAGTTATQHMIIGLTNGVPYTFTVTATNAVGTGPASAPSNRVTPATGIDNVIRVEGDISVGSYSSILAAYNQCIAEDIIEMQMTTFAENIDFNLDMPIFLRGGYDSAFAFQVGVTAVQGSITITAGTLTIEYLMIY